MIVYLKVAALGAQDVKQPKQELLQSLSKPLVLPHDTQQKLLLKYVVMVMTCCIKWYSIFVGSCVLKRLFMMALLTMMAINALCRRSYKPLYNELDEETPEEIQTAAARSAEYQSDALLQVLGPQHVREGIQYALEKNESLHYLQRSKLSTGSIVEFMQLAATQQCM